MVLHQAEGPLLELRVVGAVAVGPEIAIVGAQVGAVAPSVVVERPDHLESDGLCLVGVLADLIGAAVPGGVVAGVLEAAVGDRLEVGRAVVGGRCALVIDTLRRKRGAGRSGAPAPENGHASYH